VGNSIKKYCTRETALKAFSTLVWVKNNIIIIMVLAATLLVAPASVEASGGLGGQGNKHEIVAGHAMAICQVAQTLEVPTTS
jgi:hypothetical protein